MPQRRLQRGLYLITPDERDGDRLLARTLPLLPVLSCLQLRNKVMDIDALRDVGMRLRHACRTAGVPFIVNDDAQLAHELDADVEDLGECYLKHWPEPVRTWTLSPPTGTGVALKPPAPAARPIFWG